jgi:acyl-CoA reductase-like NAD-dependent aldehyde dehydrogenase
MLIDGELVDSAESTWSQSVNPADEAVIGRFPLGGAGDASRAVLAAHVASSEWGQSSMDERSERLRCLAATMRRRSKELVAVEVADTGNTISKLRNDVESASDALEYFAGIGRELKGETVPASRTGLHFSVRVPYGVVVRIAPFNHPLLFSSRIGAALMAGNTIVVKPPEQSSLSAGLLGQMCKEIFPPGVVNIVMGDGATVGDSLVRDPRVKRIAFTGSVATGMAVQRAAAEVGVKHVSLELGGKNPMIVFPDNDVEIVARAAVRGMNFAWQGQSCGSTSRLFLHESLYDKVLSVIKVLVEGIRIGDPAHEDSEMGPMNSKEQYDRTVSYIASAKDDGATLVTGGKRPIGDEFSRGYWIEPTIFTDVHADMRVFRNEVFGPVLCVMKWNDWDDLMAAVNSVSYGLTAAIWSRDLQTALRAARQVEAGYIWINEVSNHYLGCAFGGVKQSGVGREEGIDELYGFTECKSVHITSSVPRSMDDEVNSGLRERVQQP